jgi:uncharacterized protein (TIGR00369 family)
MTTPAPPDDSELERGFIKLVGLRIEQASGDRVVLSCPVTPDLHQPFGLVHGGVYATLAETAASVGGSLWFGDRGKVVGVSNHTDFLRAVRRGELRAEATPAVPRAYHPAVAGGGRRRAGPADRPRQGPAPEPVRGARRLNPGHSAALAICRNNSL